VGHHPAVQWPDMPPTGDEPSLDELIAAAVMAVTSLERILTTNAAGRAGLHNSRVVCTLHGQVMAFADLQVHLARTDKPGYDRDDIDGPPRTVHTLADVRRATAADIRAAKTRARRKGRRAS
jgi:hypothetical protein